jgi:hypothetical protein
LTTLSIEAFRGQWEDWQWTVGRAGEEEDEE